MQKGFVEALEGFCRVEAAKNLPNVRAKTIAYIFQLPKLSMHAALALAQFFSTIDICQTFNYSIQTAGPRSYWKGGVGLQSPSKNIFLNGSYPQIVFDTNLYGNEDNAYTVF